MTNRNTGIAERRSGRGSLSLIVILLLTSAVIRLGTGAGAALANAELDKGAAHETTPVAKSHSPDAEVDLVKPGRDEMRSLLSALQEREARATERELRLDMRGKALAVADQEITKRLKMLEDAEIQLRNTLALADGAAEGDLARLTTVYESMKPKDAAELFEKMEPDFAAGFLGRMRPDVAAAVLAGLTPEAAYSISVILAGRNANAPKS